MSTLEQRRLRAQRRRSARIQNLQAFAPAAARYLPRFAFDFVEGGVEDERALSANRASFDRCALVPRYLVDVGKIDASVELFGRRYRHPFGVAPMGIAGFFRARADLILAQAAAAAKVPYVLSTSSCDSIEAVMKVAPETTWFQLYGARDTRITLDLVDRAAALGVPVLVLTVDVPVSSKRERNARNGFSRPLRLTPSIVCQAVSRPLWTLRYLRSGGLPVMENWAPYVAAGADADTIADFHAAQVPAPAQTWSTLDAIRQRWQGPLVVKGVLHPDDALRCVDAGVQGVIISNHGGRQLDRACTPLAALAGIRAAVGPRLELMLDGGVRRGSDVLIARALGAKAAFVGRPFMYAAASAGRPGADRAIDLLAREIDATLRQLGCPSLAAVDETRVIVHNETLWRHP